MKTTASLWRNRFPDRVEVEAMFAVCDFDRPRAEKGRHQSIGDERVFGGHQLHPWPEEGMANKFDDLVRAVTENDNFPGAKSSFSESAARR